MLEAGLWLSRSRRSALRCIRGCLSFAFRGRFEDLIHFLDARLAPAVKVRSTSETLGVGTRTAKPSSFPLSSGSTSPHCSGGAGLGRIMLSAAARARADP